MLFETDAKLSETHGTVEELSIGSINGPSREKRQTMCNE